MMSDAFVDPYAERRRRNIASRAWATNRRMPWSSDDDQYLIEHWIDTTVAKRNEEAVSKYLKRTIESCRMRAENIRKDRGWSDRAEYTCHKEEEKPYKGTQDDPDDQWWSADYYKSNKE